MSAQAKSIPNEFHGAGMNPSWKRLCQLGGASALILLVYSLGRHSATGSPQQPIRPRKSSYWQPARPFWLRTFGTDPGPSWAGYSCKPGRYWSR